VILFAVILFYAGCQSLRRTDNSDYLGQNPQPTASIFGIGSQVDGQLGNQNNLPASAPSSNAPSSNAPLTSTPLTSAPSSNAPLTSAPLTSVPSANYPFQQNADLNHRDTAAPPNSFNTTATTPPAPVQNPSPNLIPNLPPNITLNPVSNNARNLTPNPAPRVVQDNFPFNDVVNVVREEPLPKSFDSPTASTIQPSTPPSIYETNQTTSGQIASGQTTSGSIWDNRNSADAAAGKTDVVVNKTDVVSVNVAPSNSVPTNSVPSNVVPTNVASSAVDDPMSHFMASPAPTPIPPDINVLGPAVDDIWGETLKKSVSIEDAAKLERDVAEKNRLLEIAASKRSGEVDPKKKYLRPFSDRHGPFASRDKRETLDQDIISPVNYVEANPEIYDNKPIYDWEIEAKPMFDWSVLDPVNFYTKVAARVGLGPNETKAQNFMNEGRDILLKIKKSGDDTQVDTSPKSSKEREKLYCSAAKKFILAAKKWPDSLLEEDALNLAAESYFFGGDYTRAFNAYQALMVKYQHSKHIDNAARRVFAIARYWESADRNSSKIVLVNFTEKSLPLFDTFGYAGKAYETIFVNDPNNPLADDAVMALAAANLSKGRYSGDSNYEKAAFYYKYLTENYPLSDHFDEARKGELFARSESYMGAEYNSKTLDDAKEIAEMLKRSRTPNQVDDDNEAEAINELDENLMTKRAEREWVLGQYYDTKRYYGSAKIFYQKVVDNYPQTTYAEKARRRLEQIKDKPDKPSLRIFGNNKTK
jgi:outer membrane protein assembly factor BamD (BamD/ComL family)